MEGTFELDDGFVARNDDHMELLDRVDQVFRSAELSVDADLRLRAAAHEDFLATDLSALRATKAYEAPHVEAHERRSRIRALGRETHDRYVDTCTQLFKLVPELMKSNQVEASLVLNNMAAYLMDRLQDAQNLVAETGTKPELDDKEEHQEKDGGPSFTLAPIDNAPIATSGSPSPKPVSSNEEDLTTRTRVATEIRDTERVYAEALRRTVEYYAEPLQDVLSEDEYKLVFGQTQLIHGLANNLYSSLHERLARWNPQTSTLGDVLGRVVEFFKMYSQYVRDFKAGQDLLASKQEEGSEPYMRVLKKAESDGIPNLESLRIQPVQRVPRYVLLLKELLKATPSEHPDVPLIKSALASYEAVAVRLNDVMHASENEAKVMAIQNSLWSATGKLPDLVQPGRRFVKEGQVAKLTSSNQLRRNCYLFCFNDLVIYASKSPIISGKFHFHRAMEFFGAFPADAEIAQAGVKISYGEAAFKITGTNGYRVFVVESDSERREWLKALTQLKLEKDENERVWEDRRRSFGPTAHKLPIRPPPVLDSADEDDMIEREAEREDDDLYEGLDGAKPSSDVEDN